MSLIDKYLEALQTGESIFPVDQFATNNNPIDSSPKQPVDVTGRNKRKHRIKNIFPENTPPHKRRVMVDFDGTIHKYSRGWDDDNPYPYDPPFEKARESISFLKSLGFEVVIFTARLSEQENGDVENQTRMLEDWLEKYDIPYDRMTAEKLAGEFYIDDNGLRIENGDWDTVIEFIKDRMGLSEEF